MEQLGNSKGTHWGGGGDSFKKIPSPHPHSPKPRRKKLSSFGVPIESSHSPYENYVYGKKKSRPLRALYAIKTTVIIYLFI
jgi:hypothetical protein